MSMINDDSLENLFQSGVALLEHGSSPAQAVESLKLADNLGADLKPLLEIVDTTFDLPRYRMPAAAKAALLARLNAQNGGEAGDFEAPLPFPAATESLPQPGATRPDHRQRWNLFLLVQQSVAVAALLVAIALVIFLANGGGGNPIPVTKPAATSLPSPVITPPPDSERVPTRQTDTSPRVDRSPLPDPLQPVLTVTPEATTTVLPSATATATDRAVAPTPKNAATVPPNQANNPPGQSGPPTQALKNNPNPVPTRTARTGPTRTPPGKPTAEDNQTPAAPTEAGITPPATTVNPAPTSGNPTGKPAPTSNLNPTPTPDNHGGDNGGGDNGGNSGKSTKTPSPTPAPTETKKSGGND